MSIPATKEKPLFGEYPIGDAIRHVQNGECVALKTSKANYVFHKCKAKGTNEVSSKSKFIVAPQSSYEHTEDWLNLLKEAGCHQCNCNLKGKVLQKINDCKPEGIYPLN